jgi:hypothetical protein
MTPVPTPNIEPVRLRLYSVSPAYSALPSTYGAHVRITTASAPLSSNSTDGLRTTYLTMEGVHGVPWDRVRLMRINMKTAKNIPWRSGSCLWFTPQRADNIMHVVRAMYDWTQFTSALDTAAVFSWHSSGTSQASSRLPSSRESLLYRNFYEVI